MNFWQLFAKESLQSPWVVKMAGEGAVSQDAPLQLATERVFVVTPGLSDAGYTMIGKMSAALNYGPQDVSIIELDSSSLQNLELINDPKKILFFSTGFPGRFGEALHWAGHQAIQTYEVEELLAKPELKKQTWQHLKDFARLR